MAGDFADLWIFDERELRRASLVAFMASQIDDTEINLHQAGSLEEFDAEIGKLPSAIPARRMVIVNLGSDSLADPRPREHVTALVQRLDGSPVAVMSDNDAPAEVEFAIQSGANAFLPSTMPSQIAIAAVRFVLSGGVYFPHPGYSSRETRQAQSARRMLQSPDVSIPHPNDELGSALDDQNGVSGLYAYADEMKMNRKPSGLNRPDLTPRQTEVLRALKVGRTNKQIARELKLSEATIKIHVRQLMKKFGAMNRTQVALAASHAAHWVGRTH